MVSLMVVPSQLSADESTDREVCLFTRDLCQPPLMYDHLSELILRYERDCPSATLPRLQKLH
jgi:hypothetical protein